jgi:hypothetical protein
VCVRQHREHTNHPSSKTGTGPRGTSRCEDRLTPSVYLEVQGPICIVNETCVCLTSSPRVPVCCRLSWLRRLLRPTRLKNLDPVHRDARWAAVAFTENSSQVKLAGCSLFIATPYSSSTYLSRTQRIARGPLRRFSTPKHAYDSRSWCPGRASISRAPPRVAPPPCIVAVNHLTHALSRGTGGAIEAPAVSLRCLC